MKQYETAIEKKKQIKTEQNTTEQNKTHRVKGQLE